jgi:hypothetical protein
VNEVSFSRLNENDDDFQFSKMIVRSAEHRYRSVCQQLVTLNDENNKKGSSNKLNPDDIQVNQSCSSNKCEQLLYI